VLTVESVEPAESDGPGVGHDAAVRLHFSVADTGIGIPADRLNSLFEAFSQVDASTTRVYGGTGLGLAITQRLVGAMGSTLEVDSVVGTGSTFHFSVVLGRSNPDAEGCAVPVGPALDQCSALIVDDNSTNRRILRLQLEGWGMRVTEADSGEVAVALVDSGQRFDVAVVDMQMPGMTGQDLAVVLASSPATRDLPLVLLSGRGDRRQALQHRNLFSAVLAKPVRSGRLHQSLRNALAPEAPSTAPVGAQVVGVERPHESLRILLAEDNAVNQRLGRLMLEKLGHHVDVVGNGREATEAAHLVPYDVVLMDVEMPEMDGLEATRVIRRVLPACKQPQIVAMTASALLEDRRACDEAGMDDYLAKPVHLQDLDAALVKAATRIAPTANRTGRAVEPGTDSSGKERSETGAIDHRVIDTLIDDLGDGGSADVADLIVTYLRDSDEQVAALQTAAANRDLQLAGSLAHKLKSSTALLGAGTLAGLLADACAAARQDGAGLDHVTSLVDAEHHRVVSDMEMTLRELAPTPDSPSPPLLRKPLVTGGFGVPSRGDAQPGGAQRLKYVRPSTGKAR
jgi:CheY-like chemotaxis protein